MAVTNLPDIDAASIFSGKLVVVASPPAGFPKSALRALGVQDVLYLYRGAQPLPEHSDELVGRFGSLADLGENNCTVAILHGQSSRALTSRRLFQHFDTVLVPMGSELLAATMGLAAYGRRRQLTLAGRTVLPTPSGAKRYLVLRANAGVSEGNVRFSPTRTEAGSLSTLLDGLNYCLLDWEAAAGDGPTVLISKADTAELQARFGRMVCTRPVNFYNEDGADGYRYRFVSLFMPHVAARILASATQRTDGGRVPSAEWQFLAYCYHLLFHEPSSRVEPGSQGLTAETFKSAEFVARLEVLARAANRDVPASFDELEGVLKAADAFPSADLLGFYIRRNRFLKARYYVDRPRSGLCTFFIRDYGQQDEQNEKLRQVLRKRFRVLGEGPLENGAREAVMRSVRGGNWSDPTAATGRAEPIYWLLCWDESPRPPSRRSRRMHEGMDNENVRIKHQLRLEVTSTGRKTQRVIHSSDNSFEALEHARLLGLQSHPGLLKLDLVPAKALTSRVA